MSKFIGFINQGIKHFFIIDGEYLGDGCNELKGKYGIVPANAVRVTINQSVLTTTFNQDLDQVSITVSDENGEIVSEEELDAKSSDQVPFILPDYKGEGYSIEITTPEGSLEGNF